MIGFIFKAVLPLFIPFWDRGRPPVEVETHCNVGGYLFGLKRRKGTGFLFLAPSKTFLNYVKELDTDLVFNLQVQESLALGSPLSYFTVGDGGMLIALQSGLSPKHLTATVTINHDGDHDSYRIRQRLDTTLPLERMLDMASLAIAPKIVSLIDDFLPTAKYLDALLSKTEDCPLVSPLPTGIRTIPKMYRVDHNRDYKERGVS